MSEFPVCNRMCGGAKKDRTDAGSARFSVRSVLSFRCSRPGSEAGRLRPVSQARLSCPAFPLSVPELPAMYSAGLTSLCLDRGPVQKSVNAFSPFPE